MLHSFVVVMLGFTMCCILGFIKWNPTWIDFQYIRGCLVWENIFYFHFLLSLSTFTPNYKKMSVSWLYFLFSKVTVRNSENSFLLICFHYFLYILKTENKNKTLFFHTKQPSGHVNQLWIDFEFNVYALPV